MPIRQTDPLPNAYLFESSMGWAINHAAIQLDNAVLAGQAVEQGPDLFLSKLILASRGNNFLRAHSRDDFLASSAFRRYYDDTKFSLCSMSGLAQSPNEPGLTKPFGSTAVLNCRINAANLGSRVAK